MDARSRAAFFGLLRRYAVSSRVRSPVAVPTAPAESIRNAGEGVLFRAFVIVSHSVVSLFVLGAVGQWSGD